MRPVLVRTPCSIQLIRWPWEVSIRSDYSVYRNDSALFALQESTSGPSMTLVMSPQEMPAISAPLTIPLYGTSPPHGQSWDRGPPRTQNIQAMLGLPLEQHLEGGSPDHLGSFALAMNASNENLTPWVFSGKYWTFKTEVQVQRDQTESTSLSSALCKLY